MLKVEKTLEPKFYEDFKTKNISKIKNWDDMNEHYEVKQELREYFTYDLYSGEIIPKSDDKIIKEKAEKTIEILNLNHNNLKNKRRNFIKMLKKLKKEDFEFIEEQESLLKYY
ncbi:MAG: hypothetical protein ACRCZI_13420, partial [Cetobacterium sp.]